VHVGRPQAELAGSGLQDNVCGCVEFLQLFRDGERAVRGGVVDDYEFPVKLAVGLLVWFAMGRGLGEGGACFSVNIFARSHVIIGRFLTSL
jgi:hypothetical protein